MVQVCLLYTSYISEEKNKLIEDTKSKMSLDDLFSQIQSGNMKELDIIVKAEVQGSVEAVKPVSNTHLAVYKRQCLGRMQLLRYVIHIQRI